MGKGRRFSQMLVVDDAYWGFINKRRFTRWVYASMTLFAMFAVVVAFFDIGAGTEYAPDFLKDKPNLTTSQMDENERLLSWLYLFVPSPVFLGWFVVYFGKFFFVFKIKRLRKARNFKYNLLWASIASAIMYLMFIRFALKMTFNEGPKFRAALVIAGCEFGLIFIEVFDEHSTRRKRHELKRLLKAHNQQRAFPPAQTHEFRQQQQQGQHHQLSESDDQTESQRQQTPSQYERERDLELQYENRVPGGIL